MIVTPIFHDSYATSASSVMQTSLEEVTACRLEQRKYGNAVTCGAVTLMPINTSSGILSLDRNLSFLIYCTAYSHALTNQYVQTTASTYRNAGTSKLTC